VDIGGNLLIHFLFSSCGDFKSFPVFKYTSLFGGAFGSPAQLHAIGQEYAQVVKMLGNGRCECFCFDGVTRLGHIRGKMRKKVWITAGDIVLVAKRDFQDEKVDIVHKYSADEARNLKQYGELPETARINETAVDMAMAGGDEDDDIGIDFDDI
jgi:translation initiation factor 1A